MEKDKEIHCPNCGQTIDVSEVLRHQLEEDIKQKYQREAAKERHKIEKEAEVLQKERELFEEKKRRENELFQDKLNQRVKEEKLILETSIKAKLTDEQSERFKLLENELNQKQEQLKELNRTKAEVEQLKRDNQLAKDQALLEAQQQMTVKLNEERESIKK